MSSISNFVKIIIWISTVINVKGEVQSHLNHIFIPTIKTPWKSESIWKNKRLTFHLQEPKKFIKNVSNGQSNLLKLRGGISNTVEEKRNDMDSMTQTNTDLDNIDKYVNINNEENEITMSNDEERYSRQLYTLGARAHKLVRSTYIVLDGPFTSGLTYECAKNIALSGVGEIILVKDDNDNDEDDDGDGDSIHDSKLLHSIYHNELMDDLGNAYQNAAKNEIALDDLYQTKWKDLQTNNDLDECNEFLLLEYIRRLNPSLRVTVTKRSKLLNMVDDNDKKENGKNNDIVGKNPVFLCIDRPLSTQLHINSKCREFKIPFVSVESRGVYGKVFCDFGNQFYVVDEDGETPKNTIYQKVVSHHKDENSNENQILEVYCVEGEKHDVSKGDIIQFNFDNVDAYNNDDVGNHHETNVNVDGGSSSISYQFKILHVKSPSSFTMECNSNNTEQSTDISDFIKHVNDMKQVKTFSRIKTPKHVPFLPLDKALDSYFKDHNEAIFAASDLDKSFDTDRRNALMTSFAALDEYILKYKRLPEKSLSDDTNDDDSNDIEQFQSILKSKFDNDDNHLKDKTKIIKQFAQCSKASLAPVQALMGALGAQEALKAASGLYNPIQQFLLYDCDELLSSNPGPSELNNHQDENSFIDSSPGQSYILGSSVTKLLASQKLFVVGSGAIGCEILKNLSAMGAATIGKGRISITDMDTIERSNLSRQLLFRDGDVGKFKSIAAQEAISRFNPSISIETHSNKVGEDVAGPFDDSFWSENVDIVLNALDNVEARLFMDKKCIEYRKGMIDAGTLGSKGNMQVVVPMQSESYGSSVDPPEPSIPVCTLKNFPYQISHTIQWGRDLFDGLFNRRPVQANGFVESLTEFAPNDLGQSMLSKLGEDAALIASEEIRDDLGVAFDYMNADETNCNDEISVKIESVKKTSIIWAVRLAKKLFQIDINAILNKHPRNSLDEDGEPFWTGTRRCPTPLSFDTFFTNENDKFQTSINQYLIDFILSAARLRMETFLPIKFHSSCKITSDEAISGLKTTSKNKQYEEGSDILNLIVSNLKCAAAKPKNYPLLQVTEFEKDDESNGHVEFITAASNLRAMIYNIPPTSKMETRRIAGKIVPAMITTTAFVSALSCLETLKMIQKFPLSMHRNAFINLALPFFAFTRPLPADEFQGLNGKSYTLWDRITIKEKKKHVIISDGDANDSDANITPGITMRQFLKLLTKKIGVGGEVTTISYGPYMIYANFLHEDDASVLDQSIWELVRETIISGDDIDEFELDETEDEYGDNNSNGFRNIEKDLTTDQMESVLELEKSTFVEFSVVALDDNTGEEVEIPPVRLLKWKRHEQ